MNKIKNEDEKQEQMREMHIIVMHAVGHIDGS